jgi:hypothetical protein
MSGTLSTPTAYSIDPRTVEDVTCGADDEHVAEPLVEDDLGGDAGVSATEQDGRGVLAVDELRTIGDALTGMERGAVDEPLVTLA